MAVDLERIEKLVGEARECLRSNCHDGVREKRMAVLARDEFGVPTIWCDPCLAPLIRALNEAGVKTVASCCGHRQKQGSILLADGTEIHLPVQGPPRRRHPYPLTVEVK